MLYLNITQKFFSFLIISALFFLSSPFLLFPAQASSKIQYFDSLQEMLIKDGFNKEKINKLYSHPKVMFKTKRVSSYSRHSESKLNYNQFLSRKNINKAKKYIKTHKTDFLNAEKSFKVEKEIITAIILVETRFGTYLGGSAIFNTLSTMAALADSGIREILWKDIEKSTKGDRKKFDAWSDRKSKWAYRELKAFLTFTHKYNTDPIAITGSYAGAMGICQFMPSNALTLARDGNKDGRIDLFNHSDAIASIANFLKTHGWKQDAGKKEKYKVLLKYNYSKYYVNTLLEIAERLKG